MPRAPASRFTIATSAAPANALADELNARRAGSAFVVQADLLDNRSLAAMVDEVVARAGRLDVLVNNASSFYPTPLGSVTEAQWEDLVGTNLRAPLFLSQAAVPHLKARQRRHRQSHRHPRRAAAA